MASQRAKKEAVAKSSVAAAVPAPVPKKMADESKAAANSKAVPTKMNGSIASGKLNTELSPASASLAAHDAAYATNKTVAELKAEALSLETTRAALAAELQQIESAIIILNRKEVRRPETAHRTVEAMADQVQRIEARMASHSTSLLEEKKNVQEIAKLTKEMTLLTEYNSFRKEMQTLQDAKTVMLSKIRDNRSTLSAVRTALKTAEVQEKLSKRKGSQVNSESVHVEHVEFSEATMNVLATKGMIVIRRIESECNVVIELERKRNLARIYGVETDAKTAKQQLSAIDFSTTDRFSVDSKDIPIVLGKNGSTVQSMESAYNVLVDIDKKNNMVVITGAASAVSKAKEALQRAIEEGQVVSVSVDGISSEAVSLLRNNAGERISKMMTDSGANISIISANNCIKIRGSQAAVNAAQEALSRFIDDTVVEVLSAPADKLGLIMGKGGSNLNQIRDAHRAMIVRLSDGFQIIGTRRDVDSARRPLKALIDHTLAGPTVIKAEEYQMGAVIGKGGSTIQRIESESGATLDVDKETCSVKIRGSIEAVAKAKRAVELVISNEQKLEIPVPADSIPGLMGKGGVNINNLAHENNVSIDIDRKKNLIKIRGSKAAIGQAQIAIKKLLVVSAPVTQSVELTPEQYSLFTSDSLSNGRYVREQTNVSIESDKKTHTLTVKGIPAAVEKAKTLIHSIASGRVYCDLPLLPKHMEQIKAQNITKLQRDSRTIVTFTESGLRISGREEDVHKAKTQLEQMLQFFFSKEIQTFPLDSGSMLLVSSARGRTALKKTRDDMNQQSGSPLILDVDRKRNCIVIRSEAEAVVETVKSAIRDMLLRLESSSNQNAPSATGLTNGNAEMCVFEFPIERHLVPRLIGRKGQSINKIKASSGLKKIDIDDAKGVAILRGTVEAVEKAKELIAETLRPTPRPLQRSAGPEEEKTDSDSQTKPNDKNRNRNKDRSRDGAEETRESSADNAVDKNGSKKRRERKKSAVPDAVPDIDARTNQPPSVSPPTSVVVPKWKASWILDSRRPALTRHS